MVYRSWIHDVKELKNVCGARGGCWTTPQSRQQLCSGVVVWMHVFAWMVDILNINFEPLTFCCVLFVSPILVPRNVIDTNMCKAMLILCECVTFVSETFTRYSSNITNVWQEILIQWLWHSLVKLCTKNYENLSILVKVTAKKISGTFFMCIRCK